MAAAACFVGFLLPDWFLVFLKPEYHIRLEYDFLAWLAGMAVTLAFIPNRPVFIAVTGFFFILQSTQLLHIEFFESPLSPYGIAWGLAEHKDTAEGFLSAWKELVPVWLLILVPYLAMGLVFFRLNQKRQKSWMAYFPLLILLAVFPCRTINEGMGINNMMAVSGRLSLYNGVRSASGYLFAILPGMLKGTDFPKNDYALYDIKEIQTEPELTVVLIMGESLNARHMSLFGYERPTTPELESLQKTGQYFIARPAIAGGVATLSSIPLFMNVLREPGFHQMLSNPQANLFRLAKKHGFKTYIVSAQANSSLNGVGSGWADKTLTKEDYTEELEEKGETLLLDKIKTIPTGGRRFIMVHQRNMHSPYENAYRNEPDKTRYEHFPVPEGASKYEAKINNYDNAMRYNDMVQAKILRAFKNEAETIPTYIFLVADHGELLGERGKWGHGHLLPETADTPAIFDGVNVDESFFEKIKALTRPTNYEIAKLIAEKLGFKIENPNEDGRTFFINGNEIYGGAGKLKVTRHEDAVATYEEVN